MQTIIFSLLSIYLFVLLGFIAKRSFKEHINEQTLTICAIYFLQPILVFWGILQRPVDWSLIFAPGVFLAITLSVTCMTFLLSRALLREAKDRSIFTIAGVVGNTGTLGITTGLVVLGPESVPYTSMMNLANAFLIFTVGAYVYSRGSFSIIDSIKNVCKLPVMWAAAVALIVNALHIPIPERIDNVLMMGAHASIVMQLLLFGVYFGSIHFRKISEAVVWAVVSIKHLVLPALGFIILIFMPLESLVERCIILELMVPIAINNINLSSLYNCKPRTVTEVTFVSSALFIVVLPVGVWLMEVLL